MGLFTDFYGNYTLSIPAGDVVLVFSFIGFESQDREIKLTAGQVLVIDIVLDESSMLLDQVVVTGSKFEKKLGEETVFT